MDLIQGKKQFIRTEGKWKSRGLDSALLSMENHEESEEQELTFNLNVNNYLEEKALVFASWSQFAHL